MEIKIVAPPRVVRVIPATIQTAENGARAYVWRCINRLDFGKKYCHESPTLEEGVLQAAIMQAIQKTAKTNAEVMQTLKLHIGMALSVEDGEDERLAIQIRLGEIDAEFNAMLKAISADSVEAFDERRAKALINEKNDLQQKLSQVVDIQQKRELAKSRLEDIYTILDGIQNRPMEYDDQIVRQLIDCVVVLSKDEIKVVFTGGMETIEPLLRD